MNSQDSSEVSWSPQETANILESLTNLIYLTRLEADNPERVRQYMDLSAERTQAMAIVLHLKH
jgi:hypothetical protein